MKQKCVNTRDDQEICGIGVIGEMGVLVHTIGLCDTKFSDYCTHVLSDITKEVCQT